MTLNFVADTQPFLHILELNDEHSKVIYWIDREGAPHEEGTKEAIAAAWRRVGEGVAEKCKHLMPIELEDLSVDGQIFKVSGMMANGDFLVLTYTDAGAICSMMGPDKVFLIEMLIKTVHGCEATYAQKTPEEQFAFELERLLEEPRSSQHFAKRWELFISRWGPAAPAYAATLREPTQTESLASAIVEYLKKNGAEESAPALYRQAMESLQAQNGPAARPQAPLADDSVQSSWATFQSKEIYPAAATLPSAPVKGPEVAFTPADYWAAQRAKLPQWLQHVKAQLASGTLTVGAGGNIPGVLASNIVEHFQAQGWSVQAKPHNISPEYSVFQFFLSSKSGQ